jgi:3'-5' exoribonuclease
MSAMKMAEFYEQYPINKKVLFLGALFHDYGKVRDYEKDLHGDWCKTQHARRIHHVSRSALWWQKSWDLYQDFYHNGSSSSAGKEMQLTDEEAEEVLHVILSHHGRREWGSPVAPNSREAWIVHLCDGMSARLNDCETLDRLD